MKKLSNKEKELKYCLGFGFMLFSIMTFVDLVTGQEINWMEHIMIPLLTVLLVLFFEWAWDSKEYGKNR